jgi:hypothetical protein
MNSQQHTNFRLWFAPAQFSVGVQLHNTIDVYNRKNQNGIEPKKRLRLNNRLS